MDIYEARGLAQTIVLADYADTWKQPKALLHDAIASAILQAVAPLQEELADLRRREHQASLRASELHGSLMEAQSERQVLHDAIFDHNIAALGDRTIEELHEADQQLARRWKALVERKRGEQ